MVILEYYTARVTVKGSIGHQTHSGNLISVPRLHEWQDQNFDSC